MRPEPFSTHQRNWLQRELDKLHKRIDDLHKPVPPAPPAEPPTAA
jgi:hypothetical protein